MHERFDERSLLPPVLKCNERYVYPMPRNGFSLPRARCFDGVLPITMLDIQHVVR